jgi:hypothetical protein
MGIDCATNVVEVVWAMVEAGEKMELRSRVIIEKLKGRA